jgi:hypothetical protein
MAALAAASIAACSNQFIYNRLDTLIPWYVRERVTLEDGQKEQLEASVRALTAWHRRSQLGRYSAFLNELAEDVQRPLPREKLEAAHARVQGFWQDAVRALAPGAASWLRTLSDEQLEELLASYAEDDEELKEAWCTTSEQDLVKRRVKTLTRSTKYWLGSVTPEQEELIANTARTLRRTGCDWVESRSLWRDELHSTLTSGGDAQLIDERVRHLMLQPGQAWTPAYREGAESNRQRQFELVVALDATLTPEQRQHASNRLKKLARDFSELAAQRRE